MDEKLRTIRCAYGNLILKNKKLRAGYKGKYTNINKNYDTYN